MGFHGKRKHTRYKAPGIQPADRIPESTPRKSLPGQKVFPWAETVNALKEWEATNPSTKPEIEKGT